MSRLPSMSIFVQKRAVPILLCLVLPLGFSCASLTEPSPPIEDSTFAQILVDLHLLSARGERGDAVPTAVRDSIYARYGVSASKFDETVRFYSRRPEDYHALYRSVVDSLKSIQSVLREETLPGGIPDSARQSLPSLRR